MPVYELHCYPCNEVEDAYLPRWDSADPPCERCGGMRTRLASRFAVPFSGSLRKYADPRREGADQEGFWAVRTKSSISGNPEHVYLDSVQAVKAFNKAEGLAAPGEVPTNSTVSADGKRILSDGMPGNWRGGGGCRMDLIPGRVWEMDKSRTSLSGKSPEPVSSGPPCTATVADASVMEKFAAEGVV